MRQRIAQRLKDSQNTYAMLTTFNEVDMRLVGIFSMAAAVPNKCHQLIIIMGKKDNDQLLVVIFFPHAEISLNSNLTG